MMKTFESRIYLSIFWAHFCTRTTLNSKGANTPLGLRLETCFSAWTSWVRSEIQKKEQNNVANSIRLVWLDLPLLVLIMIVVFWHDLQNMYHIIMFSYYKQYFTYSKLPCCVLERVKVKDTYLNLYLINSKWVEIKYEPHHNDVCSHSK